MTTILCPDLINFFEVKNQLESKGLIYIKNQKIEPSRGKNYICIDGNGMFALIGKQDYEVLNDI